MSERLWVPLTQSLRARNWNRAICGAAFTASRVANNVGTSTPLRAAFSVVVMVSLLHSAGLWAAGSPPVEVCRPEARTHPCPVRICAIGAQHAAAGATLGGVTTAGPSQGTELTAREAEVLALIAGHLTNAQIADSLFISQRTVESHVSAMLRKLQLPDRRSLARHAEAFPGGVGSGRRG